MSGLPFCWSLWIPVECHLRKRLYLPMRRIPVVAVAVLAVYRLWFFGSHVEGVPISLNQGNLFGELCHMLTVNEPLRQSINKTFHCCCQLHPSVGVLYHLSILVW